MAIDSGLHGVESTADSHSTLYRATLLEPGEVHLEHSFITRKFEAQLHLQPDVVEFRNSIEMEAHRNFANLASVNNLC